MQDSWTRANWHSRNSVEGRNGCIGIEQLVQGAGAKPRTLVTCRQGMHQSLVGPGSIRTGLLGRLASRGLLVRSFQRSAELGDESPFTHSAWYTCKPAQRSSPPPLRVSPLTTLV